MVGKRAGRSAKVMAASSIKDDGWIGVGGARSTGSL